MNTRPVLLLILHDYPPIHSAGTERGLNFARYLPEFGYEPLILTTGRYGGLPTDTESRVYRAGDLIQTLARPLRRRKVGDLPQEAQHRQATIASTSLLGWLRDRVMAPDTKLGWLLPALRLGQRLIAEHRPALIFSSSPPETAHLIAGRLSRATGVPWIADLRDGWLFEPPNPALRQAPLRRPLEAWLEGRMIAQASAVVTATAPIADDLRRRYPAAAHKPLTITNGFDAAEFAGLTRQRAPDGVFLLVYTGSLSASRQGTSADAFFTALTLLLKEDPATPLRVRIVGDVSSDEQASAAVRSLSLGEIVDFIPPVSRREAHQHQLDADGLLLITAPGQRSVATLKLFDYIGAGVPILALAENNAAAEIVAHHQLGLTAPPDDVDAIRDTLARLIQCQSDGVAWPGFAAAQQRFNRRHLTGELANLFDCLIERMG